ncbi:MAG TPA: dCTP deaminase [Patescibacteria group bacterium]|nr:dCTP deaminase [Patescibacteria group bacterium]
MLSNVSILELIKSKDIILSPWDESLIRPAGVTLRLGEIIIVPKAGNVVDIKNNILPEYESTKITLEKPFKLEPNMFVLADTLEEIGLSEKVGMLLEGRSTIARLGISVVQTAMIIDTGQKPKTMTLEIHNAGPNAVLLYPKMLFCRACFFLLNPAATTRRDTSNDKYFKGDANLPIFKDEIRG